MRVNGRRDEWGPGGWDSALTFQECLVPPVSCPSSLPPSASKAETTWVSCHGNLEFYLKARQGVIGAGWGKGAGAGTQRWGDYTCLAPDLRAHLFPPEAISLKTSLPSFP